MVMSNEERRQHQEEVSKQMLKEITEEKYAQTYGEKIYFDEVKQSGKYVVAMQKSESEYFKKNMYDVPCEHNSATYYILDPVTGKDTRMTVYSEGAKDGTQQETQVKIYRGKALTSNFWAYDIYINTADKAELAEFINGEYPKAKYHASSPLTNKLYLDWFHFDGPKPIKDQKEQKHLQAERKELTKDLKAATDFITDFENASLPLNKLAKLRNKMSQTKPAKLVGKLLGKNLENMDINRDLKALERKISDAFFGKEKE